MSDDQRVTPTAEEAVIGCILLDPELAGEILSQLSPNDFRPGRLRSIYETIRDLYNEQKPIDHIVIGDRLGEDYWDTILTCMELTPTAVNYRHYVDLVRDNAELDRLHAMAMAVIDTRDLSEARELVAKAQAGSLNRSGQKIVTLTQMMTDLYKRLAGPPPEYLHWGFAMLDDKLKVNKGKYIFIGARPSTGKTALALQLAATMARKKRIGFFSLETSAELLGDRMGASCIPGLTLPKVQAGNMPQNKLVSLLPAFNRITTQCGNRLEFIPAAGMTVQQIRTTTLAGHYDVIFVDYVQLIRPENIRETRTEQMQSVSMELRAMAQLTGVNIVALAQLKRPDTQQKHKAATMADLKESGQFEQDADVILLLYHNDPDDRKSDRWLKIDKNKDGEAGFAALYHFDGAKQTFNPVDRDENRVNKPKFEEIDGQEEIPWK